jgi:hypothetical protein
MISLKTLKRVKSHKVSAWMYSVCCRNESALTSVSDVDRYVVIIKSLHCIINTFNAFIRL